MKSNNLLLAAVHVTDRAVLLLDVTTYYRSRPVDLRRHTLEKCSVTLHGTCTRFKTALVCQDTRGLHAQRNGAHEGRENSPLQRPVCMWDVPGMCPLILPCAWYSFYPYTFYLLRLLC